MSIRIGLIMLWLPLATLAADWVFVGGGVYTVDRGRPWAEAVAVDEGRIVYVGDRAGVEGHIDDGTRLIDLDGRLLMPGFHDSHAHLLGAGNRFLRCQLAGLSWPDAVLDRIADCTRDHPAGRWLRGIGLSSKAFDESDGWLARLDAVSAEHPLFLEEEGGQRRVWANSLAMDRAGIDATTPDPPKGVIERDASGRPNGVFRGTAIGPLYQLLPVPDLQGLREGLRIASMKANAFGITTANEALLRTGYAEAFRAADDAGQLTLRFHASQGAKYGLDTDNWVRSRDRPGHRYRAGSVKLFLDGNLITATAAVLSPYRGLPDDRGKMLDPDKLAAQVIALDAAGLDVHMHAVGDRAVRAGLDAVAAAIAVNGERDRRHQIAHLSLVDADDLPRFAELGVVADIQPLWGYWNEERAQEIRSLDPDRIARLNAFADLFESGARVVAGSDWISESMNPLYGIQIAVTRRPPDGSGTAWRPEQRVDLARMIEAYTLNGAWLARQERLTGSIEVGKAADLIVLERNLFEIDPMKIAELRVLLTLLDGEVVHRADDL